MHFLHLSGSTNLQHSVGNSYASHTWWTAAMWRKLENGAHPQPTLSMGHSPLFLPSSYFHMKSSDVPVRDKSVSFHTKIYSLRPEISVGDSIGNNCRWLSPSSSLVNHDEVTHIYITWFLKALPAHFHPNSSTAMLWSWVAQKQILMSAFLHMLYQGH
jgi:hypothetical protein